MKMKICFVGVGSIARRHIKNIKELIPDVQIDALHFHPPKLDKKESELISEHFYDASVLPDAYDVIFITNPTSMHYETLLRLHEKAKHFFLEKPVFMYGTENIQNIHLRNESIYYVACPLRYTNVLQYLKNNIDFGKIYSIRCISSSYLPEWRPQSDYRGSYSSNKKMGGGVELDLIHEWDYIVWFLGVPKRVYHLLRHISDLEIDSNDIAIYIGEYEKQTVELHLDYYGRIPIRKLELFGKDDVIEADLITQKIKWLKDGKVLDLKQERDDYQKRELKAFLEMIDGKRKNDNTIEKALETLRIARGLDNE